jgi:hypothetical protein
MSRIHASGSSILCDPVYQAFERRLKGFEGGVRGSTDVRFDEESVAEFTANDPILCKACSAVITSVAAIIAVNGHHSHCFTNPADITYRIGCFSAADGCSVYGRPTTDFTWFEGFAWNFAFCAGCHLHLGWYYQSPEASFFGLILENLRERTRTH